MSANRESVAEELARLRREQESPSEELARLRNEQTKVNKEPFPIQTEPTISSQMFGQRIGSEPRAPFTQEQRDLATQGVDITSGAPVGRFASGFAQNDALRAQDLKKRLSKEFGSDVTVQQGPMGMEFINPTNNRRTLVDEVTGTFRDIADIAGPSIPAIGAVAGEILGGPAGAVGGGFVGESIRRGVGNALDVRNESGDEVLSGAMGVGLTEGAFSKGADIASRGVQGLKRTFIKPNVVSPEDAARLLKESEPSQKLADEIAARTGQPFQPRAAQLTRDPQLLVADEIARRSGRFGEDIRVSQQRNETTLEAFFDDINPSGDVKNTQVGRSIQNEARDQTQPRVNAASDSVESSIKELEDLTAKIPTATSAQSVSEISDAANKALRILKNPEGTGLEDIAWQDVRQSYGFNPDTALSDVKIPVGGDLSRTLKQLKAEAKEALDPSVSSGKSALVPDGLTKSEIDLNQLQVQLGALKRRQRLARKNEVVTDPSGRDINRVINDLQSTRDNFLLETNPELLLKIQNAEDLTRRRAAAFDKGIVGQLVRKENGAYDLLDSELISRTLGSGDKGAVEHLVAAMSTNPAGVPTLQKGFLAFYRREVVKGGIPDGAAHKRFIEKNGETLNVLFPGDSSIRKLGRLEQVASRKIKRFDDFQKAVDRSFRGRIQDLSPERIAEDIFNKKFSVKDTSRLLSLADAAGVKNQYQQAIGNKIKSRFITGNSGIQMRGLETFVEGSGEKLSAVFGPQYVSDMKKLLQGLSDIRTSSAGVQTTKNPTLLGVLAEGILRTTVARPLSPGGVGLTRLFKAQNVAVERAVAEIATNPQALRAIIINAEKDVRSRSVKRLLSVIGASTLVIDFNDTTAGGAIEGLLQEGG